MNTTEFFLDYLAYKDRAMKRVALVRQLHGEQAVRAVQPLTFEEYKKQSFVRGLRFTRLWDRLVRG
jgi:hypothetical protein